MKPALLFLPGLALLAASPARADEVKALVPDQDHGIVLDIPRFKVGATTGDRTLVMGESADGFFVSILFEENLPWMPAKECGQGFAKEKQFKEFESGPMHVCSYAVPAGPFQSQHYQAFLSTKDYLFIVHGSSTGKPGSSPALTRETFVKILGSVKVHGSVDAQKYVLPPEVYAFRDAIADAPDRTRFLADRCAAAEQDWAPHFYAGLQAAQDGKDDVLLREYGKAADLLGGKAGRSEKETRALLRALDRMGAAHGIKKRFGEAVTVLERIVALVQPADPEEFRAFAHAAHYHIAVCHAQSGKPEKAMASLTLAVKGEPKYKERAADDEMLKALRSRKDFQALVGG